jgi:glycosyltransferase involved in cell wall biosynthesis
MKRKGSCTTNVEYHFFQDINAREIVRKRFGIDKNDVVFIYAGKIIPEKGVHLLIKAALKILHHETNLRFIFIGGSDPCYLEMLKKRVNETTKHDRFFFVDAVPNQELRQYYSAADVGVWPLQCSLTMLEAMACGLPVIISDKSGSTERIAFDNGILYREADCSDLSKKLILFLDKELRNRMSKSAVAYAQTLSWSYISERFLSIAK